MWPDRPSSGARAGLAVTWGEAAPVERALSCEVQTASEGPARPVASMKGSGPGPSPPSIAAIDRSEAMERSSANT